MISKRFKYKLSFIACMNKTKEQKRELGAFYTKSNEIVDYIIKRLELKEGLSVLEPAVGDGEFIKGLEKKNLNLKITAFDIDPESVNHIQSEFNGVTVKHKNTIKENSTLGLSAFTEEKWDRILGNPPYGAEISKEEKKEYSKLYPEINITESYALFLVNSINRLNEKGILSFIISDTFLHLNTHDKLRSFILNNCKVNEIVLLKTKLFPDVNYQYAGLCIFTIQKCSNNDERENNILRFVNRISDINTLKRLRELPLNVIPDFTDAELIKQKNYSDFVDNVFYQAGIPNNLLELFMDHVKLVESLVDCKTGIYCGDNTRHFKILESSNEADKFVKAGYSTLSENETVKRRLKEEEKKKGILEKPFFVPLMKGGSGRYYKKPIWFIDWSQESLKYMLNNKKARVQNAEYYFRKGICMSLINSNRQQARIMEEVIFDQSDNGYFPKDEKYIYFFLGLFNSRLFNYMLKKVINPTANATVNYVKKIPVLMPNQEQLNKINYLVKGIIDIKKENEPTNIDDEEAKVDVFFYELYTLDEAQKKIIEDFCYHLR